MKNFVLVIRLGSCSLVHVLLYFHYNMWKRVWAIIKLCCPICWSVHLPPTFLIYKSLTNDLAQMCRRHVALEIVEGQGHTCRSKSK